MSKDDIIEVLKTMEQVIYLPAGQRKNPLTYGIIKTNYGKTADQILALLADGGQNSESSGFIRKPGRKPRPRLTAPRKRVIK